MQKFGLCLVVLILFLGLLAEAATDKSQIPVYSTQGLEKTNVQELERSAPSKEEINEQKERRNRSNYEIKLKKKLLRHDTQRLHKEKEIEYLEYRLELKKQKLEALGSDKVKGENK